MQRDVGVTDEFKVYHKFSTWLINPYIMQEFMGPFPSKVE